MLTLFLVYLDDENDKLLFEKIFYSYRKQMATLAKSILHNDADAEDAVHDVFLRIATKNMDVVRKIDDNKDLRNYLLKATKNTSLNMIKKRKQDNISLETLHEYTVSGVEKLTDDAFLERICIKSDYEDVIHSLRLLEEKYRDVLYYHLIIELTVSETAKLLDQSVSTTKKQLVRGKKKLLYLLGTERDDNNGNKQ